MRLRLPHHVPLHSRAIVPALYSPSSQSCSERALLLGHSLGSAAALQAAIDAPERVTGLVLGSGFARLPALPAVDEMIAVAAAADGLDARGMVIGLPSNDAGTVDRQVAQERSEPGPAGLRAQLFGALRVEFAGTPLALPAPPSARSVLAWLLAHPGPHARARVAAQFWPEVVDRAARASLRTALWEIRRAAGAERSAPWLSQSRDRVGVAAERVQELDLDTFRDGVAAGSSDGLRRALELARPRLLADLADDWVLELRDEVHDLAAVAAAQLAERAEAAGDHASAIQWTRRAVREAPLDEQVHRLLMLRLADAGERAEALMVFERLEAALMADVGVAPSPATIELAHRLAGRRPTSAPGRVIEESAVCRAPALEVMKLLQDPLRYREWWEGLTDAQPTADGLTRWMGAVPGTPIPTRIDLRRAAGGVVLRCEVTGIVHVWMLEPARGGCRVRLRAAVPAQEAGRWLKQQRAEVRASLPRLVAAAERAAGLPGLR